MKTKSKRFVNIATLCLALLGTTLLMEQPVKAYGRQDESALQQTDYDQEVDRGYREGYLAGSRPDAPKNPKRTLEYDPDSTDPHNGYNDGYGSGYSAGWRTTHGNSESQGEDTESSVDSQRKESQDTESSVDSQRKESQDEERETKDLSPLDILYGVFGTVLDFVLSWFE
ncbi:TPA: hypothetical protein VG339_001294 [Streptococcus pyogenes]|uniref:hypothetical protein n=1 Tax=Streptococcus pyogenes TaxID=1314 RepID=UPI00109BE919|nr:hypothetical protein [Streptococcus pyogenes]VGQ88649.1 hypothetical membrane associated protein [Streptococcus pyogenes]VGU38359.1 hypothetical membrane associated protein [Streptococcus pyogenes]VGU54156.1 hypothetical membrane associated protein [Streptococcus pyogenes]VGX33983.1 Uncharacterised protein [Streptococcus pyogenes]VHE29466.1 Uncharacterised protein [Streptococcus pyogenes]